MKRNLICGSILLLQAVVCPDVYAAVIQVAAGGNLQAAINQAQPGDTIVLQPGARFVGQFKFPAKAGMVTLTSGGQLPDRRITPADAPMLATIASGLSAMALDLYDATNWTIDGIRFEGNTGGYGEVIGLWRAEHIVLRRLLLDIPSPQEQKRFILGNGRHITLSQSYCSGIWRAGQDSQCFVAWDGAGPYTIRDNFLEAASENVMFGGSDSISPDNIPSDILVENNLFSKRLEWKGQARGVKNIFELKAARRVVIRNNVFERNWVDAQAGTAIVFTPRNQEGKAPWTVIEDVLFEYNIVRETPSHFNILGYDNMAPSAQTTGITIRHNLLLGSGGGRMATIGNEVGTVVFDHNTYINPQTGSSSMITLYSEGPIAVIGGTRASAYAVQNLTFTNHMAQNNAYGVHSSVGMGTAALTAMTRGYTWRNNVLAGGGGTYPATTTFLALATYPLQFDADYYLALTSAFKSMATDGTDLGWNARPSQPDPDPDPDPDPEPDPDPTPDPPPAVAPVGISTLTVPNGRASVAYAAALVATGGTDAYSWGIQAGTLPTGLSLNAASGAITGTPSATGTWTFTVRAADNADAANFGTATYTIAVAAPLVITTPTLPNAKKNSAYSAALTTIGGAGATTWALAAGSLPGGLTLNTSTGVISGTVRGNGTFTFTVSATDASMSTSRSLKLVVSR